MATKIEKINSIIYLCNRSMIKPINAIKPNINNNGIKNGVIIIIKNMIAKNNIIRIIKLTICIYFSCGSRTRTCVIRLMRPSWEPPPVYSAIKKKHLSLLFLYIYLVVTNMLF